MRNISKTPCAKADIEGLISYSLRQRERLLTALCASGAYGWICTQDGRPMLCVVTQRKGISVSGLKVPEGLAAALVQEGLADWHSGTMSAGTKTAIAKPGTRRLLVSDAGRAHMARVQVSDGIDPFLAQHSRLEHRSVATPAGPEKIIFDEGESPLAWLARRKGRNGLALINADCLAAGERLRADLTMAHMLPRVTANWSGGTSGGPKQAGAAHYSDIVTAAKQRVDRALENVGVEFSGLLVDVCGFLKGLEIIESERNWPQRSAKIVLRLALTRLARHYGIASVGTGPARARGLVHWGSADFRPQINAEAG